MDATRASCTRQTSSTESAIRPLVLLKSGYVW